jgi:hypothetical protein
MRCPSCGAESLGAAKFCQECGARLAGTCPGCGHEVDAKARFCPECGRALSRALAPGMGAAPPSKYTPRHLAEKILTSRAALESERKQVTVLFADLKGSMELLAERSRRQSSAITRR